MSDQFLELFEIQDDSDLPEAKLPPSIYEKRIIRDKRTNVDVRESYLLSLLGDKLLDACRFEAANRGQPVCTFIRQEAILAMGREQDRFDLDAPDGKKPELLREPADDDPQSDSNRQLKALLGQATFTMLVGFAKTLNLKNVVAFRKGFAKAINAPDLLQRIEAGKKADIELMKQRAAAGVLSVLVQ